MRKSFLIITYRPRSGTFWDIVGHWRCTGLAGRVLMHFVHLQHVFIVQGFKGQN